jgi:hypothetical protein
MSEPMYIYKNPKRFSRKDLVGIWVNNNKGHFQKMTNDYFRYESFILNYLYKWAETGEFPSDNNMNVLIKVTGRFEEFLDLFEEVK